MLLAGRIVARLGTTRTLVSATLVLALVAALFGTVTSATPAAAAPGHSVELRVLVLSVGDRSNDPEADLIAGVMDTIGVPYDIVDVFATDLTEDRLRRGGVGRYNGVILTDAELGGLGVFSAAEWATLHEYERDFNVHEAVLSGFPVTNGAVDYGMTAVQGASFPAGVWTSAASSRFRYLGPEVPPIAGSGFTAVARNNGGVTGTVLLSAAGAPGRALMTDLSYRDGRRVLLSTIGHRRGDLHSMVMAYLFIDHATQGLHLGAPHVHLAAHIDDLFLASAMWDIDANQTSATDSYRTTAADISATVAAQYSIRAAHPTAADFRMEMAFNGIGLAPTDPLTQAVQSSAGEFLFLNHTHSHRLFDTSLGADHAEISFEIGHNAALWESYGFPGLPFAGRALVTGGHSGLSDGPGQPFPGGVNPGLLSAMIENGVDYVASDTSAPNQAVPQYINGTGVLNLPRYPTNVYYNVRTPAQMVDEFNVIHATLPDHSYQQILALEAQTALRNLVSFSNYPYFFHAANLADYGGGNSLMADWLRSVLGEYERFLRFPVRSLPFAEIGDRTAAWLAAPFAGITATLVIGTGQVTVNADSWLSVPVTGVAGGSTYGSLPIRDVSLSPTPQVLAVAGYEAPGGFPLPPGPGATPTAVPTPTPTPGPTATSTPVPTSTPTPGPTATSTPVPTSTPTPVPTATSTPVPTSTPTPTVLASPTPDISENPVPEPTPTPPPDPGPQPSPTPTPTPGVAGPVCHGLVATIVGTDDDEVIEGTDGPDVIVAFGGDDVIDGGGGDDVICAGRGADVVVGGSGDDVVFGQHGRDAISGGGGVDTIWGGRHRDEIRGGPGADVIVGGRGPDVLIGRNGRDTISGGAGADTIHGGRHADIIDGGLGVDTCSGGRGLDTVERCEDGVRVGGVAPLPR